MGHFTSTGKSTVVDIGEDDNIKPLMATYFPKLQAAKILQFTRKKLTVVDRRSDDDGIILRTLRCTADEMQELSSKIDELFLNLPFEEEPRLDFKATFMNHIKEAVENDVVYSLYSIDMVNEDTDGQRNIDLIQLAYCEIEDGDCDFMLEIAIFIGACVSEARQPNKTRTVH